MNEPTGPDAHNASGPVAFPAVAIVHGFAHVQAAIAAARRAGVSYLTLATARGAPDFAGAAWCAELERLARAHAEALPLVFVVDCADAPGRALEALSCGATCVALAAPLAVFARIQAIAAQTGATVLAQAPSGPDLAVVPDEAALQRRWRTTLTSNAD